MGARLADTGHTSRGKWSESGVPKKGWTCDGIDDLGSPSQTCEMCESVEIRYVHEMSHPRYPGSLLVGCVCAEHMEDDYVRPREREARLRKAASRRKTWDRRKWSVSARGNAYLNTQGFNITVHERGGSFGLTIQRRETGKSVTGRKRYPSEIAAKEAGLKALLWAEEHLV
jgi:hypothetical protein